MCQATTVHVSSSGPQEADDIPEEAAAAAAAALFPAAEAAAAAAESPAALAAAAADAAPPAAAAAAAAEPAKIHDPVVCRATATRVWPLSCMYVLQCCRSLSCASHDIQPGGGGEGANTHLVHHVTSDQTGRG